MRPKPEPAPAVHSTASARAELIERSPLQRNFMSLVVTCVLMVGMAIVAIVLGRSGGFDRDPSPTRTQAGSPAPQQDAGNTAPAPGAAPPAAAATALPEAVDPPHFCLAVGTYLFDDRAIARSRHLTRSTGLKSWVVSSRQDGTRSYRIMLGGYATVSDAEQAADKLLTRGVVSEALVEPLPTTRPRR